MAMTATGLRGEEEERGWGRGYKRKEGDRERHEEERKGGENEMEGEKRPGAHRRRNMLKTGPSHMLPRAQAD